jgi:hypothetical protein
VLTSMPVSCLTGRGDAAVIPIVQANEMGDSEDRLGVLVLRAWVEKPGSIRVRITRVVGWEEPDTVVLASVNGACALIETWLHELCCPGDGPVMPL